MLMFVPPSLEFLEQTKEFKQSFIDAGEESIPGSGGLCHTSVEEWCRNNPLPGYKRITLLTYDTCIGKPVGIVDIRPSINVKGVAGGGVNLGYSIAPPYRGKGYGKLQLAAVLSIFRSLGMPEILIGANKDNIPSTHVIQGAGGEEVARAGDVIIYKVSTVRN